MTALLVIGYGNEKRGDEGVGPCVARAVAGWTRPEVRALAAHHLGPELIDELKDAGRVIFVAAGAQASQALELEAVGPAAGAGAGHTGEPAWLLALTGIRYGRCPPAWRIAVPARDLRFGEGLSRTAERGMVAALRQIRLLLEEAATPAPAGDAPCTTAG
jgi:hydrogenase maturation protease